MGVLDRLPLAMLRARPVDGIVGTVTDANAAAVALLGRPRAEVVGADLGSLLGGVQVRVGGPGAQARTRPGAPGATRWVAASAALMPPEGRTDDPDEVLVVLHDISEHKHSEEQLSREARHDALTGLLNRTELVRLLGTVDPAADGPHVALIFLDLDGFKHVNDSRGHQVGDELLVAVARRIRAAVRPEDWLARIGGDEFVVVCPRLAEPADARAVAERVRATLDTPLSIEGREHRISMSLGVAVGRSSAVDPPELLRQADMAMYRAKDSGRNTIRIHSADMDAELVAEELVREALEAALSEDSAGSGAWRPSGAGPAGRAGGGDAAGPADAHGGAVPGVGLVVHFQPIVEIDSGLLSYVEALARLRDSAGRLIPPSDFLPVAARGGLTGALSEHVLRLALRERARWQAEGIDAAVGLNLAAGQAFSASFASDALRIIREEAAAPSDVVLEMGELDLLEATGPAQLTLGRLRASGIGLAIDHFGTGYSSLGALRFLGPHRVKIDRSLVASITASAPDRAIVTAAISAAHALGQRVVAEGVETVEQLEVLAGLGCDEAQGFLVAPVLPAAELDPARAHWEPRTLRRAGV